MGKFNKNNRNKNLKACRNIENSKNFVLLPFDKFNSLNTPFRYEKKWFMIFKEFKVFEVMLSINDKRIKMKYGKNKKVLEIPRNQFIATWKDFLTPFQKQNVVGEEIKLL